MGCVFAKNDVKEGANAPLPVNPKNDKAILKEQDVVLAFKAKRNNVFTSSISHSPSCLHTSRA